MSLPLKVAFLWHQHQPYYRKENEFILPWTRLHGAKDYFDLPAIAEDFPSLKQTFNLAPSLVMQLDDYIIGAAGDVVQTLSKIPAEELTLSQKREILRLFFLCNGDRMIAPYRRYNELWTRSQKTEAIAEFSNQDWRDIQAWYNLTWIGNSARREAKISALFEKGENFTLADIDLILDAHIKTIKNILPIMKRLRQDGRIEASVTPQYHPIIPLLIDSQAALESLNCNLPEKPFAFPQDAATQIERGIEIYSKIFGDNPQGVWFSEGSVSDATLELAATAGIRWTVSDEEVLWASLPEDRHWTDKYFPKKYISKTGEISVLFRDHSLSDAIGFVYSRWQADHAADDFCNRLRNIRAAIIERHGEEALECAVVPIVLDGENCWEYYYQNGEPFLRELFSRLTQSDDLATVTCGEAVSIDHLKYSPELRHIRAGSWINANFKIWIGHPDDNAAWSILQNTREVVERRLPELQPADAAKALEHCYIAEGSDWFWWYGDEHTSENQVEFDELFRWNLSESYRYAGVEPPNEVFKPIGGHAQQNITPPKAKISPKINGSIENDGWENAGHFEPSHTTGAMHASSELLRRVSYGVDNSMIYFRFETTRPLRDNEEIILQCHAPRECSFTLSAGKMTLLSGSQKLCCEMRGAVREAAEAAASLDAFTDGASPEITIKISCQDQNIMFPRNGTVSLRL